MLHTNKKHAPNERLHISSPDGAAEYRQVVERSDARRRRRRFRSVAEKEPLLSMQEGIKTPTGWQKFCRAFGTYLLCGTYSRGFASLHHLPVFCRTFSAFLIQILYHDQITGYHCYILIKKNGLRNRLCFVARWYSPALISNQMLLCAITYCS